MALKGTLRDFALPDIFQLIGMQRKTGILTLEGDREAVTVVFEKGMVVHADSSVRRLDDLLGNVLVRQGKLKKEVLEEVLAKQKASMQRLGHILTSQGYIESKDLKEALSEQMQQIVFRIFRWKEGQYYFDPSPTVDYDRENVIPMSADHILMEGIRRVDEWPIIEKRIPSLAMIFRPLVPRAQIQIGKEPAAGGASLEVASGEPGQHRGRAGPLQSGVVLSGEEAKIYGLLDGKTSITALVDMTGMSEFDVCRVLFDFLDRNLISAVGQAQERAAPAGEQVPAAAAPSVLGTALTALVLVASAFGLYLSLSAPFRAPGLESSFGAELSNLRRGISLARLQRVDAALRTYYLAYGIYPSSLDDLVNETPALIAPEDLRDSWSVPFSYEFSPERVRLTASSAGGEPYLVFVHELGLGAGQSGPRVVGSSRP